FIKLLLFKVSRSHHKVHWIKLHNTLVRQEWKTMISTSEVKIESDSKVWSV
ncbi:hypothetical protein KIL84_009337, partial [Mauremys mutica]